MEILVAVCRDILERGFTLAMVRPEAYVLVLESTHQRSDGSKNVSCDGSSTSKCLMYCIPEFARVSENTKPHVGLTDQSTFTSQSGINPNVAIMLYV